MGSESAPLPLAQKSGLDPWDSPKMSHSQGDSKLFMMKHSVGNIASMEACEAACHADPTAFLGKQQLYISYDSYVNIHNYISWFVWAGWDSSKCMLFFQSPIYRKQKSGNGRQCGLNDIKFEKVEKKSCELSGTCRLGEFQTSFEWKVYKWRVISLPNAGKVVWKDQILIWSDTVLLFEPAFWIHGSPHLSFDLQGKEDVPSPTVEFVATPAWGFATTYWRPVSKFAGNWKSTSGFWIIFICCVRWWYHWEVLWAACLFSNSSIHSFLPIVWLKWLLDIVRYCWSIAFIMCRGSEIEVKCTFNVAPEAAVAAERRQNYQRERNPKIKKWEDVGSQFHFHSALQNRWGLRWFVGW